ncbi:hypothetical protein T310_9404, partial [Rasamsonia emersonii CBS 393.64]
VIDHVNYRFDYIIMTSRLGIAQGYRDNLNEIRAGIYFSSHREGRKLLFMVRTKSTPSSSHGRHRIKMRVPSRPDCCYRSATRSAEEGARGCRENGCRRGEDEWCYKCTSA